MRVEILTHTEKPAEAISFAAGVCYGKRDASEKRMARCFSLGHMSVFEQASVQLLVEGISRACSHQLVRHRLNSYCQESQRYCRIETDSADWYVVPPEFGEKAPDWYARKMKNAAKRYRMALDDGMRPEDARFLLPEACKTSLVVTMNFRSLFNFLDLRLDKAAQWEVRQLARNILAACMKDEELAPIVGLYVEKIRNEEA